MAQLTQAVNLPATGINRQVDPTKLNQSEYTYLLNGVFQDGDGKSSVLHIYPGNRLAYQLPPGYIILNRTNAGKHGVCLFLLNPVTGEGMIGLFDGRFFRICAASSKFNFKQYKQIQAAIDENYNGGLIVYWVDNHNPVRFMDLNNPPMLDGVLDIDALELFRRYQVARAEVLDITAQGRLLTGAYYITLQYADENGNGLTGWSTPVGPVFIYRDSLNQALGNLNGSDDKVPTGKAIRVGITNADPSYQYMNVGIVRSYSGIRSAVIASTIPVFQQEYLYTGNPDIERDVDLKEIIQPAVAYSTAKTISLSNGQLLLGNLKGSRERNLQPYFSRVGVQWQVVRQKYNAQNSYANPVKSVYELQYRRNEVYALGIVIKWKDGTKSRPYPFVGRAANTDSAGAAITATTDLYGNTVNAGQWDSGNVSPSADVFEGAGAQLQRWQVYNTAYRIGDELSGDEGPSFFGEMGYWESSERYPQEQAVWGANAGLPIRLFRMPDFIHAPLCDGENGINDDRHQSYFYKLGIRFTNIDEIMASLPADVKADIAGWEMVRADRRNNKSVTASGLLFNMFEQNWNALSDTTERARDIIMGNTTVSGIRDDVRMYPNYPLNDLNPDWLIKRTGIAGDGAGEQNDRYRKDVFSFLSPDTCFNKALLFEGELQVHCEMYGVAREDMFFLEPYPQLKDRGDDYDKAAYQVTTVGYYNNWKKATSGNLRRRIKEAMYIPFNSQVAGGVVGKPVHNVTRESTVMLAIDGELADTVNKDTSRVHLRSDEFQCVMRTGIYRLCASHYASIINKLPNQYGGVFDFRYISTNVDDTMVSDNQVVFGGDTFIGTFSAKRQMAMYQNLQAYMNMPDGSDNVDLKTSMTIANQRYYYLAKRKNTSKDSYTQCAKEGIGAEGLLGGLIGLAAMIIAAPDMGALPCLYTGVPVFFAESDYNLDLRVNGEAEWETYYPNLQNGAVRMRDWAGVKHVDKDGYYGQNPSFSEQNDLFAYIPLDPFYKGENTPVPHYATRVIRSLRGTPENRFNNLTVFLPLNYYDFQRNSGELEDIRDVGNYRVMFKMSYGYYLERLYTGVDTNAATLYIGTGQLFNGNPELLGKQDGEYAGCISQSAHVDTKFGSFFLGRGGNIFHLAEGLNEIGANGLDTWFIDNMPLQLLKDLPNFKHTDNPANPNGIGYSCVWDNKHKLVLFTKIDYEVRDKEMLGSFTFDAEGYVMYNGTRVELRSDLFINRSFTIGYSPVHQRWISWYSFHSPVYFELNNTYYSFGDGGLWSHDNPIPRTYYGKRFPFIYEGAVHTEKMDYAFTHSVGVLTRAYPMVGGRQGVEIPLTFNKAVVYNDYQCTGDMVLTIQDENDLSTLLRMPVRTANSIETFLRRDGLYWDMGELYDLTRESNEPIMRKLEQYPGYYIDNEVDHNQIDYTRDYKQAAYLRDMWVKVRYTFDLDRDVQLYVYLLRDVAEQSQV